MVLVRDCKTVTADIFAACYGWHRNMIVLAMLNCCMETLE